MITTAEFKKQIAKPFGQAMRQFGFKGTGFEYHDDTNDFLFAIYIEGSRWGGSCSAGFAVHPKQVDKNSQGKLNLQKLMISRYEFKMGLSKQARGLSWEYSDDEQQNLKTLFLIIETLKNVAFPVIAMFKTDPNVLESFEVNELNDLHDNWAKYTGVYISTTQSRFAWATSLYLEKRNLPKAKQFAKWCLDRPNKAEIEWFGDNDLKRIIAT